MKKRLTFDFETRSMADLKKVGAYKYSLDPTTQPTCLAFKTHAGLMHFLDFDLINQKWSDHDFEFQDEWIEFIEGEFEFSAHNVLFDRCIYENILVRRYGWPKIPARLYRCTAAKAAACALPRNLAGAGEALGLTDQKDPRGYVAMMKTCKPTKAWAAWSKLQTRVKNGERMTEKTKAKSLLPEPKVFLDYEDDPQTWETLYEYCRRDVLAEEALDIGLPDLIPQEQEIWHLNQALNWRGVRIDIPTVKKIVGLMAKESEEKLLQLDHLTMGLITRPGARDSILDFLREEGVELPNLRAKTVDDSLSGFTLSEDAQTLLEIRKALSSTSTRKYHSFLARANEDDRARDILLYHGASTGRDTGVGLQIQNFPRGVIKVDPNRPYANVENAVECGAEMLKILYGESLGVFFSSLLRNMILPTAGHEIFAADFSKIEVAVLWWLAGNEKGLSVLRSGKDPYIYQAMANTGKSYEGITEEERQLGKAQILGCGFGMGAAKFKITAWDMYRLKLTEEQSKKAIKDYRTINAEVPAIWRSYETAALSAVENPRRSVRAGKCLFEVRDKFLWVELPSGRRLAYREPRIGMRESDYGPQATLEFYAVNSKTKKWGLERTWGGTLTENIVQGTARDLMMPALVRLEKAGYRALFAVHDEAVCEYPLGQGDVSQFVKIMCQVPSWAKECPIEAKGWCGPRYKK